MKQPTLTKEQVTEPTTWDPTGKSPGNTPQAKLQNAQLLMQMAVNPATGIDVHELTSVIIQNGALANAGNIQISKEQMQDNASQQQAQQLGATGGPGPNPQVSVNGGGAGPAGVLPPPAQPSMPAPNPHGPMPVRQSGIQGPGSHPIS